MDNVAAVTEAFEVGVLIAGQKARGRKEVRRARVGKWLFIQYLVPCGKKNCKGCPHGPYWYAVRYIGGRAREFYVGKRLVKFAERRAGELVEALKALENGE